MRQPTLFRYWRKHASSRTIFGPQSWLQPQFTRPAACDNNEPQKAASNNAREGSDNEFVILASQAFGPSLVVESVSNGRKKRLVLLLMDVPFTIRMLDGDPSDTLQLGDLKRLLPATYRTRDDDISVPTLGNLRFLQSELLVRRLNVIQDSLWFCGRPMPPRPLHYQSLLSRDIKITENPELHLVWSGREIYLKPLPLWLLDHDFWLFSSGKDIDKKSQEELLACARGLLFSYTALVAYESDFRIAIRTGLLPPLITWEQWKTFTSEYLQNHSYSNINPRYWYGELRLGRLNKLYRLRGYIFRGYSKVASRPIYDDILKDNFETLAVVLGYVVVVLSAMQVGLATQRLNGSSAFQSVSYGFTVFSIIAPVIASVAIVVLVALIALANWIVTHHYRRDRFKHMGMIQPHLNKA